MLPSLSPLINPTITSKDKAQTLSLRPSHPSRGGGTLTDNSWGYTLDNTTYSPVPTKDQSPATIYNTNTATASTTTPETLNLTYAVKTDDTIPSGTYTNDLVYTVNVKPECLQYTLKFNLDNGTGKPGATYTDRQLSYGTKINLADFTPTRTDYEFMGWIATTNNPTTTQVTFAGNSNIDVNPANETEVTLTAKWKLKPKGIYTISNMQQMNQNICRANTTPLATATQLDTDGSHHGDPNYVPTKTLTDTRDNSTYTVSKLADGKCWMTQNLRIIDKTITPADSNVTANYTIPASAANGFNTFDVPRAYVDPTYGGYYNFHTVTAGFGRYSSSTEGENIVSSICPKGWRLPTSYRSDSDFHLLYNKYNSSSRLLSAPVNFTLSGLASNLAGGQILNNVGSTGFYASSTVYNANDSYTLTLNNTTVNPALKNSYKINGFNVRCIADDPTIHSISTMQQMTPEICAATTTPLKTSTQLDTNGSYRGNVNYVPTKTLVDTRDNNTYTVSKLADGKCWMTQNLRIIDKTITPADSDVTANYTIPASSNDGGYSYNTSRTYYLNNIYGGYYVWYTATAGTGTTAITIQGQNAPASICPKGWRLPTGGTSGEFLTLYNNYNSSSMLLYDPINLKLAGNVNGSSHYSQDYYGYYWSSTVYSDEDALGLRVGLSDVIPVRTYGKLEGFSVRCIAR